MTSKYYFQYADTLLYLKNYRTSTIIIIAIAFY